MKEFSRCFTTDNILSSLDHLCWQPVLQSHMLIWKPSLPKYNFQMAQVMQWPPAIRNYMRKVRLKYQHVRPIQLYSLGNASKKSRGVKQWRNQATSDARAQILTYFIYVIAGLSVMMRQVHSFSLSSGYICQRSCAFRQYNG